MSGEWRTCTTTTERRILTIQGLPLRPRKRRSSPSPPGVSGGISPVRGRLPRSHRQVPEGDRTVLFPRGCFRPLCHSWVGRARSAGSGLTAFSKRLSTRGEWRCAQRDHFARDSGSECPVLEGQRCLCSPPKPSFSRPLGGEEEIRGQRGVGERVGSVQ